MIYNFSCYAVSTRPLRISQTSGEFDRQEMPILVVVGYIDFIPKRGQQRAACNSCNECIEGDRTPIVHCPPAQEGRLGTPYLDARVEPVR